jgi:hypothetical protein
MAGCSTSDANSPYSNLKLNEIRQAPGGQLALIFTEKRGQPPGHRVYLTNAKEINRDLTVAWADMKNNPGYGETFAGGVILHRRKAPDGVSPDTFWMQLDPFELSGNWTPPLAEPGMTQAAVDQWLPLQPELAEPSVSSTEIATPIIPPPSIHTAAMKPDQHFLWETDLGAYETAVSAQPIISVNPNNSFAEKSGRTLLGGAVLLVAIPVIALAIVAESRDDCPPKPVCHR